MPDVEEFITVYASQLPSCARKHRIKLSALEIVWA